MITPTQYRERMEKHIKLCRKNLKSSRVKCCATCPFEDLVLEKDPELRPLFEQKRQQIEKTKDESLAMV